MGRNPGKVPCTARSTRTGQRCKRYPALGATVCSMHGGRAPQVRAAAKRRAGEQAATRELARLGVARRDISPGEALLELVQYTAAEVDYWRARVSDLDEGDLVWGVTKTKSGGDDYGTTEEAKPHIAYVLLKDSSDRLATYAAAALRAGVEERRVRLAESQGGLVAAAIRRILGALSLTPDQVDLVSVVVPRELRALTSQEHTP